MSYYRKLIGLLFEIRVENGPKSFRSMVPNVVIMSRPTMMEITRGEGRSAFEFGQDKTQPDRIFKVRIVYDNTMQDGEMLVAEAVGDL